MKIETNYSIGNRVLFYSDDCGKEMTGDVIAINTESAGTGKNMETEVDYTIDADEVIKSSSIHIITEVQSKSGTRKRDSYIIKKLNKNYFKK